MHEKLEQYHKSSFGWAMLCCLWNREQAEEVLQSTYLKILQGKAVFKERSEYKTWLFGVIRNTAKEVRRQQSIRKRLMDQWTVAKVCFTDQSETSIQTHSDDEQIRKLRVSMMQLSKRQRAVLHLVFYQNLTIEQAAEVMQIPIGTARTHYARGKKHLKKKLMALGENTWKSTAMTVEN